MTTIKECCHNCKFHQMNPADMNNVWCRRNPPTIFLIPQGARMGQMAAFPNLPKSWHCGEYKPLISFDSLNLQGDKST